MNDHEQVIRARISHTEEYFLAAWDHDPRRPMSNRGATCASGIVAVIVSCTLIAFIDRLGGRSFDWKIVIPIGLIASGLVVYWTSPAARRRQILQTVRKMGANPGTQSRFEFRPDGFVHTEDSGINSLHPWSTVRRVIQHPDGLMIGTSENFYYWVPETAFERAEDYQVLAQWIGTKVSDFKKAGK